MNKEGLMRNDFIAHSAKGTAWKNVKYIKKVMGPNGKMQYFYTMPEYEAFIKKSGGGEKQKSGSPKVSSGGTSADKYIQKSLSSPTPGDSKEEKVKYLRDVIAAGHNKIASTFESEAAKEESSSKKKSGSSSGKSKGASSKTGKGGSGAKSSSGSKEKAAKEKSSASSAKKATTEKKQKEKATANNKPIDLDTLKKVYGKKDEDVNSFNGSAAEFKNDLLSKYDEGDTGYIMAGDKAYKFSVENGQVVLKDYDSDKEVSFDEYLKDVRSFKEFQTNKKSKK